MNKSLIIPKGVLVCDRSVVELGELYRRYKSIKPAIVLNGISSRAITTSNDFCTWVNDYVSIYIRPYCSYCSIQRLFLTNQAAVYKEDIVEFNSEYIKGYSRDSVNCHGYRISYLSGPDYKILQFIIINY